jgi:hypothetical protein
MVELHVPTTDVSSPPLGALNDPWGNGEERPKPVPEGRRVDILKFLRLYREQELMSTRQSASQTSFGSSHLARPQSETVVRVPTPNTSISGPYSVRSPTNTVLMQKETVKRHLPDSLRARKSLMRKLGACSNDCRARKIKASLKIT